MGEVVWRVSVGERECGRERERECGREREWESECGERVSVGEVSVERREFTRESECGRERE